MDLTAWSIGRRLYLLTFVLAAALLGVLWFAKGAMGTVSLSASHTETTQVPQLQRVAQLELDVTRVSLQLRHAMLARSPAEQAEALADIGIKRRQITQTLEDYARAQAGDGAGAAKVADLLGRFWKVGEANLQLVQAGRNADAFAFLVEQTIPARNQLLGVLAEAVQTHQQGLRSDLELIRRDATRTLQVLVALVVAVGAGLLLFAWYISSVLRRRVALSRSVAERVRDGDLSVDIQDRQRDEFTPLLSALADMQLSLRRVVAEVRGIALGVETASAEIAQGNADLSARTELQAGTLQNTASAMEQLSATVRQNADSAQRSNQLAQGASSVATEGGKVVGQVVDTMRGINDSSRQVVDIVSVIDSIAFQTNILALNAAVEAARAGEQGRGFAVVAAEVRSLAGRSAAAAKEVKALIANSVERVEQGTQLVDRAGSTMQEIVAAIQRVTDLMAEISSASAQQSAGVAQVGQSVTQMDQATQQNAALVEQSAAAAASLNGQAQKLVQAMAVFRLDGGHLPQLAGPG